MDNADGSQEERFLLAFEQYSDALFRHASIRLADRERAIDVVHDTFTRVWGYIREGHEVESFRPFLYKVLNNLIIDEYRKRKSFSLDEMLEGEGVDEGSFPELREGSLEALVEALDAKRALDAIEILPDIYKEVVTLRFVDGLGPKEISVLIEETENVVSVRLHRGVRLLREHIEREERNTKQQ